MNLYAPTNLPHFSQILSRSIPKMTAADYDGDDDDPVDPSPVLCVLFDPDDHVLSADHEVDLGDR